MHYYYPVDEVPATPDFVLRVMQDWTRQSIAAGETDCDFELTGETTIAQFRYHLDLVPWEQLARGYNKEFRIDCSLEEWSTVLTPQNARTVDELCRFLAQRISEPLIRPLEIAGVSCRAGGVFLTIRSLLVADGADPDTIYPSAAVGPFLQKHSQLFVGPISRLAPGSMPTFVYTDDATFAALFFCMCLFAIVNAFSGAGAIVVLTVLGLLQVLMIVLSWFVPQLFMTAMKLEQVTTFKDLSRRLAE
ncbi:MAG: hypothetical protein AB7O26_12370 [Planctomycetaceae bacterium]